jgi:adenine-specific DNA-methyltransferase
MDLVLGDCLEAMAEMEADSVDAIVTDPPYFKVKGEGWDRQWGKPAEFLAWLDVVLAECQRLLRPNGSLYLFASPRMAARVECLVGERFNVLNRLTWRKEQARHKQASKEALRSFFPQSEAIIFAEHYGADSAAKGESGYGAKCDELRGFVFEPLRAYLDGERRRAGVERPEIERETGTQMFGHWFSRVQWALPTTKHYATLQRLFNSSCNGSGPQYLRREYEDLRREYEDLRREYEDLRREYEDLRREYEDLRRPFNVSADVPYTDVWDFPAVAYYPGKHPCEKPLEMMRHIVTVSTRPGDIVLDPFMGSGTTGVAAVQEGRFFVGIELEPEYHRIAQARIAHAEQRQMEMAV